jgi:hypothetical protein
MRCLLAAGWAVRDKKQARIAAEVDRRLSIICKGEVEFDSMLQRAQALWQMTLTRSGPG